MERDRTPKMTLTRRQFDQRLKKKSLKIALIGMSNIGKSHRAKQLEEKGFSRLSIDDLIAKRLGIEGTEAMAHWMGFPFEKRYPQAEQNYLKAEAEAMQGISYPKGKNLVVDTTGSLVYHDAKLLGSLKEDLMLVHLQVAMSMIPEMTDRFFMHPKPVIWGGMFTKDPKESIEVALRRCYNNWLRFRLKKYLELADVSISGEIALNPAIPIDQFLAAIREGLKS